ncbi:SBBP repeat-containing protein [Runella sp.]|uniref:SBBP repeat-containing protein n=1 Tax=Runella sp. TaxID=1960881 RepID=UPI003D119F27
MKHLCLLALVFALHIQLQAQNTTISPTVFSPPKLSYDAVLALSSPQEGDVVYDITFKCLRVYLDGKWLCSYQDPSNYTPNLLAISSAGGTGVDEARSIAVDGNGNVYVTGYFEGTATFGTVTKTSAGYRDIFVAKYDKSGSVQWVQSAGGTGNDFGYGIAVDGNGNVYVTGAFSGTATFGSAIKTSAGETDIFITKYNPSGMWQWTQFAGGTHFDYGNKIAVDSSNNVFITGFFYLTAKFGRNSKTSAGSREIFIGRLDK